MKEVPHPQVDVVIVNYRSYEELSRCLWSLDSNRADFGQVIVIDQESDARAAATLRRTFPWIHLVERATNDGFAAGVNVGVRLSQAPFVLLLNPDCVLGDRTVPTLLEHAAAHPRVGVFGPRILNADGTVQGSARRFPNVTTLFAGRSSWLTRRFPNNPLSRRNLPAVHGPVQPVDVDWVSGACMLIRREVFDEVGGMDERFFLYWEDADFCFRAAQRGWRTLHCPAASVEHAGGRSSVHMYRESLVAFHHSAFLFYCEHFGGVSRLFQPVVWLVLRARLGLMLYLYSARLATSIDVVDGGEHRLNGVSAPKAS